MNSVHIVVVDHIFEFRVVCHLAFAAVFVYCRSCIVLFIYAESKFSAGLWKSRDLYSAFTFSFVILKFSHCTYNDLNHICALNFCIVLPVIVCQLSV